MLPCQRGEAADITEIIKDFWWVWPLALIVHWVVYSSLVETVSFREKLSDVCVMSGVLDRLFAHPEERMVGACYL